MTHKTLPGPGERATRDGFQQLRFVAEGMSFVESARRGLHIELGAEALKAHKRVVERLTAIARCRCDARWRLLGIAIPPPESVDAGHSISDWASAETLDARPESEQLVLYSERFGAADPALRRRATRNTRLRERRLALLGELEALALQDSRPSDQLACRSAH